MRGRIAYLNTDLSAVMKQLEKGLEELHKAYRDAELDKDDKATSPKPNVEAKKEEVDEKMQDLKIEEVK